MTRFADDVPAILWSSYNGQRKGEALADVLTGEHNPGGHLPFTWYRDEQLGEPGDYNIRPHEADPGRTYRYFQGTPSYAFGHGLSYSDFDYGDLRVDSGSVDANGTVTATATITNRSDRAGSDVVQLYSSSLQRDGDDPCPDKRLADFQKVQPEPGDSTEVTFRVPARELAFFDEQRDRETIDDAYKLQLKSLQRCRGRRAAPGRYRRARTETAVHIRDAAGRRGSGWQQRLPRDVRTGNQHRPASDGGDIGRHPPRLRRRRHRRTAAGGVRISYESNRPEVVQVDGNGVHTRSAEVATVTATVHHRGETQQTFFTVHVGNGS